MIVRDRQTQKYIQTYVYDSYLFPYAFEQISIKINVLFLLLLHIRIMCVRPVQTRTNHSHEFDQKGARPWIKKELMDTIMHVPSRKEDALCTYMRYIRMIVLIFFIHICASTLLCDHVACEKIITMWTFSFSRSTFNAGQSTCSHSSCLLWNKLAYIFGFPLVRALAQCLSGKSWLPQYTKLAYTYIHTQANSARYHGVHCECRDQHCS